jgi:hypothetical protein
VASDASTWLIVLTARSLTFLGESEPRFSYTHQLDPSYLDDAKLLTDYLRRADTPSRTDAITGAASPGTGIVEPIVTILETR